MIRSMTAFARSERQGEWGKLSWELRSVNHRYLDLHPRLPEELRFLEPVVRERAGRQLSRGKVECTLRWRPAPGHGGRVGINEAYAQQMVDACDALARRLTDPAPVSPLALLCSPGVMQEGEPDLEPVAGAAATLLDECLVALGEMRGREGARLAEIVRDRARRVGELAEVVRARRVEVNAAVRERLLGRIADLGVEADGGRLEQELAIIAQRLDVDEELERLAGHVAEIEATLEADEPVGRRLDFLMQELNREANTLSSKSSDQETTRAAVEMKVLIEQMREQIQNIE
jgi:uncharacterized protein (TIGR00255 family)